MHRFFVLVLTCLSLSTFSSANDKLVISQWLTSPALQVDYPAFHSTENTLGKTFSNRDLLVFEHIDLSNYYPEEGLSFPWAGEHPYKWGLSYSDNNGYVFPDQQGIPEKPMVMYLASYITVDRWLSTQLEIKSPYMFEAWLNGTKIGTKDSIEDEENTIGKVTQELKLQRGTHLLIIKALRPPDEGLAWKLMANLEIKEPYLTENVQPGTKPDNIKNINHILDGIKISRVHPSPDGTLYAVSYSQSHPPNGQSESWTEIKRTADRHVVYSFRHSRINRLTWLPKSNAVSYTSTREGKTTLYYHHMETGEQRIIAKDMEKFGGFHWTPDEQTIIYSMREEGSGTDENMRRLIGMNDRQPKWRDRSFLYKLDVSSGFKTRLTYGNTSTTLQDISPDSKDILFSQSRPDYLERPFSTNDLFLLNLETLEIDTIYYEQPWGITASFSPDGSKLLATGGPSAFNGAGTNLPEDAIPNNYDTQAYIYDLNTRSVKCITYDFNPSVSSAYWHPMSNQVFLLTVDQDYRRMYRYDIRRESFHQLETGVDFVTSMSISDNGQVLTFLGNQVNSPKKAYITGIDNEDVMVLENVEAQTYKHVTFGQTKEWDFTASSGETIKGRYYLPPDFDPKNTYPVIVYYYGGTTPVGRSFGGRYPFNTWAGNGYVVYVLQPSGAIGFGQAFSAAHVNNWGITVADEIIEGTRKFLDAHPFADSAKVGCAGASYGGFMTMLLTTRTDIFAAAISHAGISSISSYWGEGYWGYSYSALATAGNFPWNNKDIFIGQSPLFHADKVTTPLLLLTGDNDTNVPPGESIQMYTALKLLDREVELVMVKGEDHHILTYNKRIQWHNTIMAWWDKYLKNQPEWWEKQYPSNNY